MIPKTTKALEKDYLNCEKRKKFILMEKSCYKDYMGESASDLSSAQKEIETGDLKWALVKAYQSLFLLCNAILIKNRGFYSKDHKCLITALMKHSLISKEACASINKVVNKENLFEEINEARLERNQVLYFPKSRRQLNNDQIKNMFEEIKQLFRILWGEL